MNLCSLVKVVPDSKSDSRLTGEILLSPKTPGSSKDSLKLRIARSRSTVRASVLLEVVLALALFVAAATVITAGINASIQAVDRVRLQNHAANLAISVMSELQMHARPIAPIGPESFEAPFQDWLYRIAIDQEESSTEAESLRSVEVIVWHTQENAVHRLTQLFRAGETSVPGTDSGGAL